MGFVHKNTQLRLQTEAPEIEGGGGRGLIFQMNYALEKPPGRQDGVEDSTKHEKPTEQSHFLGLSERRKSVEPLIIRYCQ